MLLNYGHASITVGDKVYSLLPSFQNIAKLGSPKEIISKINSLDASGSDINWQWLTALEIVNCCLDEPLPIEVTGEMIFSERKGKLLYKPGKYGKSMFDDMFVLAAHCIKHGICGPISELKGTEEPLLEFDPYDFIESAQYHLKCSLEEAANMTMTQFVRNVRVRLPDDERDQFDADLGDPNVIIVDGVRYEKFTNATH